MQTVDEINAKRRARYNLPENREINQAKHRARYGPVIGHDKPCNPYLGLKFNSKAVQTTLTKWGG